MGYRELPQLQRNTFERSYKSYIKYYDFYNEKPGWVQRRKKLSKEEYYDDYVLYQDLKIQNPEYSRLPISKEIATEGVLTRNEAIQISKFYKEKEILKNEKEIVSWLNKDVGKQEQIKILHSKEFKSFKDFLSTTEKDIQIEHTFYRDEKYNKKGELIRKAGWRTEKYEGVQALYLLAKLGYDEEGAAESFDSD